MAELKWPENKSSLCVINEELFASGDISKRSARRIGFELAPGVTYETGDHLAVKPLNTLDMVYRFAACFATEFETLARSRGDSITTQEDLINMQLQRPFDIECIDNGHVYPAQLNFEPKSLLENLQVGVSFSISESSAGDLISVIKRFVSHDGNPVDAEIVRKFAALSDIILEGGKGREHHAAMDSFLSLYPTVVDLLEVFAPVAEAANTPISLADVLSILPRLQPRLYSISSSPINSPSVVEISAGVLNATTDDGVNVRGVCSNYLARLEPFKDRALVTVRASSFRAPKDIVNTPMLLVGAGTGLAPLMGFLEDRSHAMASGEEEKKTDGNKDCHLIFGCRNHDERIYRAKLDDFESSNVLDLHLALSRSPDRPKMYVHNVIQEKGKVIADLLLKDDCTYYICGDAAMADSCHEAIIEALREHANMSRVMAANYLKRMRMENRWQYDLWGTCAFVDEDSYSAAKKDVAKRKSNRALQWLSTMKRRNSQILGDSIGSFSSSATRLLSSADFEELDIDDY